MGYFDPAHVHIKQKQQQLGFVGTSSSAIVHHSPSSSQTLVSAISSPSSNRQNQNDGGTQFRLCLELNFVSIFIKQTLSPSSHAISADCNSIDEATIQDFVAVGLVYVRSVSNPRIGDPLSLSSFVSNYTDPFSFLHVLPTVPPTHWSKNFTLLSPILLWDAFADPFSGGVGDALRAVKVSYPLFPPSVNIFFTPSVKVSYHQRTACRERERANQNHFVFHFCYTRMTGKRKCCSAPEPREKKIRMESSSSSNSVAGPTVLERKQVMINRGLTDLQKCARILNSSETEGMPYATYKNAKERLRDDFEAINFIGMNWEIRLEWLKESTPLEMEDAFEEWRKTFPLEQFF